MTIRSRRAVASPDPTIDVSTDNTDRNSTALTSLEHLFGVLSEGELLDLLRLGALDHFVNVDALQMDILRGDVTDFNNLVGLNKGNLCVLGHGLVEVVHSAAELAVAQLVGLVDFDQSVVTVDSLFQDVLLAVEFASFFRFRHFGDGTILVVAYGEFTSLHWRYQHIRL